MRRLAFVAFAVFALILPISLNGSASAQGNVSCADYDAWEWAQSDFESHPFTYGALDPDFNGIVCEELPHGFAPALWTDHIPADVQEAQIVRTVDGDTFEVLINGVSNRVRIYRADTPETKNEQHCGGKEATNFAKWALSFNDTPGTVYIEKDVTEQDRYRRELAYLWFEVDGKPYMLNHILINNGWADDIDYGDRKYDQQFKRAAAFAERHQLGAWPLCDPDGPTGPEDPWERPKNPGQQLPLPTQKPAPSTEVPQPPPPPAGDCDPNYTPCVPLVSYDLDCRDIGFSVTVVGSDPHGFDGDDNDGFGCESY